MMKRREFITLLSGAAAAWPVAVRAQQPPKLPTIGFLGGDESGWTAWTAAFIKRLHELGWIEGRTIAIEYRWSEELRRLHDRQIGRLIALENSANIDTCLAVVICKACAVAHQTADHNILAPAVDGRN